MDALVTLYGKLNKHAKVHPLLSKAQLSNQHNQLSYNLWGKAVRLNLNRTIDL
jgi:hypothetical protein